MSGFTTDAEALKTAANEHLELAVDNISASREKLKGTMELDTAFSGGENPGTLFTGAGEQWGQARHYFLRVLDDNAENLALAAEALREIADRYIEADRTAAEGMPS